VRIKEIEPVSDPTATAIPARLRWRIEASGRADLMFSLRDYFRRLGCEAAVASATVLELETDEPAEAIEAYVGDWARVNGTPLHLEQVREERQMLVPPPAASGAPRLGTLLVGKGYVTEEQLAGALAESHATKDLLGVVLLRKQLIFEDELARTLSQQLAIPYISIRVVGVDASVMGLLPASVGAAAAAIPVRAIGDAVQVAFADPTDQQALAMVSRHLKKVEIAVAELTDIRFAWRGITEGIAPR